MCHNITGRESLTDYSPRLDIVKLIYYETKQAISLI